MASVDVRFEIELEIECSNADAKKAEEGEDVSAKLTEIILKIEDMLSDCASEHNDVDNVNDTTHDIVSGSPDD